MAEITHIVAIDGPAGAGKSSVARRLAQILGFAFLDTGAMYRAGTWRCLEEGVDMNDPEVLADATRDMSLDIREEDGAQKVYVDGRDVTEAIRSPEVTRMIYKYDQYPQVREQLVALQRRFGAQGPTVAEGRDIGTVVFPQAKCKIYLDAALDERARRRMREKEGKGVSVDFDTVRTEMAERDIRDRTREASPLRCADDAIVVDTTSKTFDEVVEEVARLARAVL